MRPSNMNTSRPSTTPWRVGVTSIDKGAPASRSSSIQLHPYWRVIARLFLPARPFVDARAAQAVGRLRRAQQMIEPEAEIALPAARGVVPECVELVLARVEGAQRIGPALVHDPAPRIACLGLHHRVV